MTIAIDNLSKRFVNHAGQSVTILDNICLDIGEREIVTVLGPSGCGKTTLLNCIAGLEPYSGSVFVMGTKVTRPPDAVSVVFQSPHLLPWRTVRRNIEFGLESQSRLTKSDRADEVGRVMDLVRLTAAADKYPKQLSGGMQQRVNIARALAMRPRILLMDEPFGALDAITKEHLQEELQAVAVRENLTIVFITHDIAEAVYLGDRVLLMAHSPGRIARSVEVDGARPRPLAVKRSTAAQEMYLDLWKSLGESSILA
jgi:NitT/TauT family transport system ATP-binding protein